MNENKIIEVDIETFLENNHTFLKKGYVAQEDTKLWCWYQKKPEEDKVHGGWDALEGTWIPLHAFNIKKEEDWAKTLYRVTPEGWEKL